MKTLVATVIALICVVNIWAQEKPEGLFINSKAPDFKVKDTSGAEVRLRDLVKKGPVVIVFYRGNWCPYCNKYLKRLEDSLQLIKAKGGQVIAITPEKPDGIAKKKEKTSISFPVVYDEGMKLMKAYGVAYTVDDRTVSRYKNADIDLADINGQKPEAVTLPIPAIYIIDKDITVKYRFFDSDYKKRASVKEILQNL